MTEDASTGIIRARGPHNGQDALEGMMLTLDDIRKALTRGPARNVTDLGKEGGAAVAMILVGHDNDLSLCVIRRAKRTGDPWSGHMAFPGGRFSADDTDPCATAERETREEIGLELDPSHRLGALQRLPIWLSGRNRPLVLFPTVYYWGGREPVLELNEEVDASYWMPLSHAWDRQNSGHTTLATDRNTLYYPALRYGNERIWGITLRVLTLFSDVVDRPLPHFEEIPGLGHSNPDEGKV